jgi:MerR HTH family regulatory protein
MNDALQPAIRETLSTRQLSLHCGLQEHELAELVEYGALVPDIPDASHWTFNGRCAFTLARAIRLRRDLLLEFDAFALAVTLLAEISFLEDELRMRGTIYTANHPPPISECDRHGTGVTTSNEPALSPRSGTS